MAMYTGPLERGMRVESIPEPGKFGKIVYGPISWAGQTICDVEWEDGERFYIDVWDAKPAITPPTDTRDAPMGEE